MGWRTWITATPSLLAFAGALGACAHGSPAETSGAAATADLESTLAPRVLSVSIRGNHFVDEDAIVDGLALAPHGFLKVTYARMDPLVLEIDSERIEWYYRKQGLFSARVVDVDVTTVEGGVRITFTVDEGEPTRIKTVDLRHVPDSLRGSERLAEILEGIREGQRFIHDSYLAAKDALGSWLIGEGYAHAEVKGQVLVARKDRLASVILDLDPGPQVRFGATKIVGLDGIPESTVRSRLAWERGQIFDPDLIATTRTRLFDVGHLKHIDIDIPHEGRPAVVDVTIHAEPDRRRELRLGLGVAADPVRFEIRGRAGYTLVGYLDPLLTLHFDARPAYTFLHSDVGEGGIGGEGVVSAEREDFWFPKLLATAEVGYRVSELEAYAVRGPRARLSLRRPILSYRLVTTLAYEVAVLGFFDIAPAITPEEAQAIGLISPYRIGTFQQSITYDHRDSALNPARGYYLELSLEEAGAFSGSLFDYVRGHAEARGYVPIGDSAVIAGRVRYARVASGELPITQRYFAGGATSHRGFGYRHLAPSLEKNGESVPFGGPALFLTTLEGRMKIATLFGNDLSAAVFTDGGDVPAAIGKLDLFHLHWAVGGGLRYETPVGPVRVDLGVRINRLGPGEPDPGNRYAFHLSLGQAF
ncbi:MAG TPA: BamA/TamA family outer membrane protein [Kofleriaceae bacterium]|nr:BamA/TamA family outer membrane protein [Kofleriaceae bacterium]